MDGWIDVLIEFLIKLPLIHKLHGIVDGEIKVTFTTEYYCQELVLVNGS